MPRSMLVPKKLALFVTLSEAAAALVIAPAEARARLPAVLEPASCVALSSVMFTAPAVLNVSEPKFIVPPGRTLIVPPAGEVNDALPPTVRTSVATVPRLTFVPVKLALLAMTWLPLPALRIWPLELSARLFAVLLPKTTTSWSSAMETVPGEL